MKKGFSNKLFLFLVMITISFTCFIGIVKVDAKTEYACLCKCGDDKDYDFITTVDEKVDSGVCKWDTEAFGQNQCSKDCYEICEDEEGIQWWLDMKCYATNKIYHMTYDVNGGLGCDMAKEIAEDYPVGSLCSPEKLGYVFDGWYTSIEGGEKVTKESEFDEDITVYAHWSPKPVTCAAGSYLAPYGDAATGCSRCVENYYCPGGDYEINKNYSQGIYKCPDYNRSYSSTSVTSTYSDPGARTLSNCYFVCPESTYFDGERCAVCPSGSYSYARKVNLKGFKEEYLAEKQNPDTACDLRSKPHDDGPSYIAPPDPCNGCNGSSSSGGDIGSSGSDIGSGDIGSSSGSGDIDPYEVNGITLNVTEKTIKVGETFQLKATVTPRTVKYKKIIWTSTDPSVVNVDYSGKIKGIKAGNATIIASCNGKVATARITVTDGGNIIVNDTVSSISISPSSAIINVGSKVKLSYRVTPSNVSKSSLVWVSSNPKVASVDSDGTVKGLSKGTTKIILIAKDGSASAASIITVKEEPIIPDGDGSVNSTADVRGLILSPTEATIDIDEIMTLILETIPFEAKNKSVTWKTSNPSIVEVTQGGVITGKSYGQATVTATTLDGRYTVSMKVTVAKTTNSIDDGPGVSGSVLSDSLFIKLLICCMVIVLIVVGIIIYNKYKKNKEE